MTEKEMLKQIDSYYQKLKKMNKSLSKQKLTENEIDSLWKMFQVEAYNFKEIFRLELVSKITDKNQLL